MRGLLGARCAPEQWPSFAASWNALGPDPYLASHGRRRLRRHAVYSAGRTGPIRRQPHQPHFQSLAYNPLQGDIERWFEPVLPSVAANPVLHAILDFGRDFFSRLAPAVHEWRMELHQFRIEANADAPGEPTPEGVHRDGVDYVLVLLIDRYNIASGTTTIQTAAGSDVDSFTLSTPLESVLVDDRRVHHGVTPVTPLDPALPSHRDVLVLTLAGRK